jgi:prepilin-type N-terminal cleavage/methylation domain-containing protein/prepilin-type processing-associated H-X9-DG protein
MQRIEMTQRKGFTLIELLVVIAIIAILAAILFPVFAKARERARQTTCINNVKQMGTAYHMYLDDWDGVFQYGEGYATLGQQWGWVNAIRQYNKTLEIWHCPSSSVNISYTTGGGAASYPAGFYAWGEGSIADVKNPSKFIHICEAIGSGTVPYDYTKLPFNPASKQAQVAETGDADATADSQCDGAVYHGPTGANVTTMAKSAPMSVVEEKATTKRWEMHFPGRHSGNTTMVFLDGHAKAFKDWVWNEMTMRRHGPYPAGDRNNCSGSNFPEP